jgi:hypothetical protein
MEIFDMLNNKVNEENGQQPCVVFESVKAWLGTAENLRYIDNNSNPFYVRDWKIMNYDPYNSSEGKGFDIFFHTTVFFRDVEPDSDQPSHTVVTKVDDGIEWLGHTDLHSSGQHINADTGECHLKFNAILAIMRRAAEIDVDFAIEMHEDSIVCA